MPPFLSSRAFSRSHSKTGPRKGDRCALSGGATALIFLPALRAAKVDWSKITLFWADERAVPADDPESNYGIADRMLLSPLGAKAPRAIRMPADMPQLGEAAVKYDEQLATELRGARARPGVARRRRRRSRVLRCSRVIRRWSQNDLRAVAVEDAPRAAEAAAVVDAQVSPADAKDLAHRCRTEKAAGAAGGVVEDATIDAVGSGAAAGEGRDGVHRSGDQETMT